MHHPWSTLTDGGLYDIAIVREIIILEAFEIKKIYYPR